MSYGVPLKHLMTLRTMKLGHAYLLLACLAATPALAQASASITAGSLSGNAQAGATTRAPDERIARGPRTDDTRNCDTRGGSSAMAGGASPGSRTEIFGCEADRNRITR